MQEAEAMCVHIMLETSGQQGEHLAQNCTQWRKRSILNIAHSIPKIIGQQCFESGETQSSSIVQESNVKWLLTLNVSTAACTIKCSGLAITKKIGKYI